ncbi:hypothetical protein [Allomuricauda sp. R78024]|uniref:hypothetical protein n=1 Tax=Allomuricauda sp. R78024 TaxID=3093867 RepID=UPI0037C603E2
MKNTFLIILLILFTHFQSFSQGENEQGKHRILTYGTHREIDIAEQTVNQKWNIEKVSVAGCRVNQKLVDSVKTHNRATWELIDSKSGFENSEWKYRKDLMETKKDLKKLKSLVYKHDLTNRIWKNLKNKRVDYLIFENLIFIDESKYSISIKKRKRKIDDSQKNGIYNLIIDLSTESVTIEN